MAALPDIGELSYNGAVFDALYKSRVSSRPIMAEDGRAVKFLEYAISVDAHVVAYGQVPGVFENSNYTLRQRLTQPGGKLRYRGKGFGGLDNVNAGGAQDWDVAWGPWPQLFDLTWTGSNLAAYVTWQVKVRIPLLKGATTRNRVMAFSYSHSFSLDRDGYTTVKTNGQLEIPITRTSADGRGIPDNADRYRSLTHVAVPFGYSMEGQDYSLSTDRRTLSWSVTHKEMPAALPRFVTQSELTHDYSSSLDKGFRNWDGSLSGSMVAPPGSVVEKKVLYNQFLLVLRDRLYRMGGEKPGEAMPFTLRTKNKWTVLLTSLRISDSVFGRGSSFSCTWRVLGATLADILTYGGLWQPVHGTNFTRWQQSLTIPWSVRGANGAGFNQQADAIVDLGTTRTPTISISAPKEPQPPRFHVPEPVSTAADLTPKSTWLQYDVSLELEDSQETIRHRPLVHRLGSNIRTARDALGAIGLAFQGNFQGSRDKVADVIQNVGTPKFQVGLIGKIKRVRYQIPTPILISVAGQKVRRIGGVERRKCVAISGDDPIYHLEFEAYYDCLVPPNGFIPTPTNPVYQETSAMTRDGKIKPGT